MERETVGLAVSIRGWILIMTFKLRDIFSLKNKGKHYSGFVYTS